MLMVMPESSCLVLISQHIKIQLLKQSVSTARIYLFLYLFFCFSNFINVIHNKFKSNFRFSCVILGFFHMTVKVMLYDINVCICGLGCV